MSIQLQTARDVAVETERRYFGNSLGFIKYNVFLCYVGEHVPGYKKKVHEVFGKDRYRNGWCSGVWGENKGARMLGAYLLAEIIEDEEKEQQK